MQAVFAPQKVLHIIVNICLHVHIYVLHECMPPILCLCSFSWIPINPFVESFHGLVACLHHFTPCFSLLVAVKQVVYRYTSRLSCSPFTHSFYHPPPSCCLPLTYPKNANKAWVCLPACLWLQLPFIQVRTNQLNKKQMASRGTPSTSGLYPLRSHQFWE